MAAAGGDKAGTAAAAAEAARPYLAWVLVGLAVLAAVGLVVLAVWWWRKRRRAAPAPEGRKPLEARRLTRIHKRFLKGLPWRYRVAVQDFPTVVVLGPAGSGKTRLIGLEVDWQRQAHQFMPSHTEDPLLQLFLGPDRVVQEVSAPLLEDGSLEARRALRKLWKGTFRRQKGLVVIALDARWLAETPPDEVRRITQLVRGKLNLLAEVCKAPVETRLCLTHMDSLDGFADFAQLLRGHGVPLHWDVPPPGEEGKLAAGLQHLEQYFALGLVSLSVDAFERLENFYARGGESFAALARFVSGLSEGAPLAYPPKLTRVYLSSPVPEARSLGALTLTPEKRERQLRSHFKLMHLRRCAAMLAVGCLPVLAAYGHFYLRLGEAQAQLADFRATVRHLQEQNLTASGEVVEGKARATVGSMESLWSAARYWPPLNDSFTDEVTTLRAGLAGSVRLAYLKPLLERCQEQCVRCGRLIPGCAPAESGVARVLSPQGALDERCERETLCRPEQMVHLLAVVHAARGDDMGRYILSYLGDTHRGRWHWASDSLGLEFPMGTSERGGEWMEAAGLRKEIVGDYIVSSDRAWPQGTLSPEDSLWIRWPYEWLAPESYQGPWRDHLKRLQQFLSARELDVAQWRNLEPERKRLQATLAQSAAYASTRRLLALLDASNAPASQATLKGVEHTLDSLDWLRQEQKVLAAVLRMEEEISAGLAAAENMSTAELLTRTGGLFIPSDDGARLEVRVLQQSFEFRPRELSKALLEKLIRQLESGRPVFPQAPVGGLPAGAVASASETGLGFGVGDSLEEALMDSGRSTGRMTFDVDIKPLVDEFTTRMAESKLTRAEAAQRQAYVLRKVAAFARQYKQDLLVRYRDFRFTAGAASLASQLSVLAQPSSELTVLLREVADGAGIGPLEGPYYEPLRRELAMFRPLVQLMAPDKDGQTAGLVPYLLLVSQLHTEVSGMTGTEVQGGPLIQPASLNGGARKAAAAEGGGTQLVDLLSPLGRVALSMMLEEEGSYLGKVDAWLDKQGILGELRRPFREPFLVARELGRAEVERVLDEQWEWQLAHTLEPLLRRYPFNVEASQELDPAELDVLRRKDGAFWQFVSQVLTPVVEEKGTEWMLRRPLRQQFAVPPRMLLMLGRLSKLARTLWDDEGKPRPLPVQVRPLPLPASGTGAFVTMSFFKCGTAAAFGFNQTPAWQEFPVSWWEPRTASVGVELRVPGRDSKRYRSTELSRSSWNCFRLMDAASFDDEQNAVWPLPGPDGAAETELRLRFGMRGGPWTLFQEVAR